MSAPVLRKRVIRSVRGARPTHGLETMTDPQRRAARRARCGPGQSRATRSRAGDDAHESQVSAQSGLPLPRSGRNLRSCTVGGRWLLEPARGPPGRVRSIRCPHGAHRRGGADGWRTRQRTVAGPVHTPHGWTLTISEAINRHQRSRPARSHRDLPFMAEARRRSKRCPSRSIENLTVRPRRGTKRCRHGER